MPERMPHSERRQHVFVDAGNGVTAMVQQPAGAPPLTEASRTAIEDLIRAAAARMARAKGDGADA